MKSGSFTILSLLLFLASCSVEPKPINYGEDDCSYCRMTIVDRLHAAEIVTDKGKVYKYDAIECMMNDAKDFEEGQISLYLCNHYKEPSKLINAQKGIFLISKKLPSPMGGYLTAFPDRESAEVGQQKYQGKLLSWDELVTAYSEL